MGTTCVSGYHWRVPQSSQENNDSTPVCTITSVVDSSRTRETFINQNLQLASIGKNGGDANEICTAENSSAKSIQKDKNALSIELITYRLNKAYRKAEDTTTQQTIEDLKNTVQQHVKNALPLQTLVSAVHQSIQQKIQQHRLPAPSGFSFGFFQAQQPLVVDVLERLDRKLGA